MTLNLEVGKKYMCRDGSWPVKIVKYDSTNITHKYIDEYGYCYTANGSFASGLRDHPMDLVSEYVEQTKKPEYESGNDRKNCKPLNEKYNDGDLVTFKINNFQADALNDKEYQTINLYKEYIVDHKPAPEPRKGTFWVNVYEEGFIHNKTHKTRESADKNSDINRLACVEVNWTEGDGL